MEHGTAAGGGGGGPLSDVTWFTADDAVDSPGRATGNAAGGGHVPDPEEMVHMLVYFQ